jgi:hypothetical protein
MTPGSNGITLSGSRKKKAKNPPDTTPKAASQGQPPTTPRRIRTTPARIKR